MNSIPYCMNSTQTLETEADLGETQRVPYPTNYEPPVQRSRSKVARKGPDLSRGGEPNWRIESMMPSSVRARN